MRKARFYDYIALSIILLVGAVSAFMSTNMLMSDVGNYKNSFNGLLIFVTLSHLVFAIELVTFLIFLSRYLRMDVIYRRHHIKTYAAQFIVHSSIGLIATILSGSIVYHNFLAPYPYQGAIIVCLILHILVLLLSVFALVYTSLKKGDEEERYVYGVGHGFYTAVIGIFVFFAMNHFGGFICSFIYADYSHFWLTFPFYFSLLIPFLILVAIINPSHGLKSQNFYRQEIIVWSIFLAFGLATSLYTAFVAINDPMFVSLVSAAMPLERLATTPYDSIMIFGVNIFIPLGKLIYSIIKNHKSIN